MRFDYIDIGTSNFDTSLDLIQPNETIMLIEPIKYYLNDLPNGNNITKVNCAISPDGKNTTIKVYYIPSEVVDTISSVPDPSGLKGCNRIGDYHPLQLPFKEFVVTEDVPCFSLEHIFNQYNVDSIGQVKIDTEGCDVGIMYQLIKWLKSKPKESWPKTIIYETFYAARLDQDNILEQMSYFGYSNNEKIGDTIFTL